MDVSMKYHQGRVTNEPIEYDDAIETQDVKITKDVERKHLDKSLRLTINLKEKKIVTEPNQEEIKQMKNNDAFKDKTSVKKQRGLKQPKFATSTPKHRPIKIKANSKVTSRTKGG